MLDRPAIEIALIIRTHVINRSIILCSFDVSPSHLCALVRQKQNADRLSNVPVFTPRFTKTSFPQYSE